MGGRTGSTRFGFSGGGAESDEPPQPAEPPRNARTLYGRDLHSAGALTAPPGSVPHPASAPANWPGRPPPSRPAEPSQLAPAAPALADSAYRPAGPSHSGKSNFPARAGFWGRRNSHGEIVPLTDPGLVPAGMLGWRVTVLPHALVVLASAALSFGAVMLVMKLREPAPAPVPVVPAPAASPHLVTPPPPAPPPVPAQVLPRSASEIPAPRTRVTRPRRSPGQPPAPRPRSRIPGPDDPIPPRF